MHAFLIVGTCTIITSCIGYLFIVLIDQIVYNDSSNQNESLVLLF